MSFSTITTVNKTSFLRALAICLVVANHSLWIDMAGGMNFLLLLSGFNFARFSLEKNTPDILKDFWRLISKIAIPSLVIILFYSLINQRFRIEEILMFSNFLYLNKVSDISLPIWYPQILIQIGIILSLVILTLPKIDTRNRVFLTAGLLVFSLSIHGISTRIYDASHLLERLPTLYLWNFVIGWLLWALLEKNTLFYKSIASVVVIITSLYTLDISDSRFTIFTSLSLLFIWMKDLKLPAAAVQLINMIASATLYIFLLHLSFFNVYDYLTEGITLNYKIEVLTKFSFSVLGCLLTWLVVTAGINAYKTTFYQGSLRQPSSAPTSVTRAS